MNMTKLMKLAMIAAFAGRLWFGMAMQEPTPVQAAPGGGPHVRVFSGQTGSETLAEDEDEVVDDLRQEASSPEDSGQSSSHSTPEYKYVPVRRY